MFKFIAFTPLLEMFTQYSGDCIFRIGTVIGSILFSIVWVVAGYFDYKRHEVPGYLCLCITISCAVFGALFDGLYAVILTLAFSVFIYRREEFSKFGSADFLIFNHFYLGYGRFPNAAASTLLAAFIWLFCLIAHLAMYRDENGNKYKPFSNQMIPAIPSYAASVAVTSIIRLAMLAISGVTLCFS